MSIRRAVFRNDTTGNYDDGVTDITAEVTGGGSGIPDPGGSNDDVLQRKTGAWTNRTIAQLLTDLAAAGTTFQPLDSDLTSIAALATTSFGRSVLTQADAAALRTLAGLGSLATLSTITSSEITNGTIVDADVSGSAAIAYSKLALSGSLASGDMAASAITGLAGANNPWTVVRKGGDTSRNTTTTVAADPDLAATLANGVLYEVYLRVMFSAASTTPDLKFAFAEDTTIRGSGFFINISAADAGQLANLLFRSSTTANAAALTTARGLLLWGTYLGNGASASFQWAQNTSDSGNTTVLAGSTLAYRAIS